MHKDYNVFEDLGFSSTESVLLAMKSELHGRIVNCASNYSQNQLQQILHEPQPRISDLMRGKISKFSMETLLGYADALHMRPEIKTHAPVEALAAAR